MSTPDLAMVDSIILKWKRLIQWLADERLAKERNDIKYK
jgi:hypothetical protein